MRIDTPVRLAKPNKLNLGNKEFCAVTCCNRTRLLGHSIVGIVSRMDPVVTWTPPGYLNISAPETRDLEQLHRPASEAAHSDSVASRHSANTALVVLSPIRVSELR